MRSKSHRNWSVSASEISVTGCPSASSSRGSSSKPAALNCVIVEHMLPGGMLEFRISSRGKAYTQRVVFASNTKKSAAAAAPGTQVTEVTWKLNRVEKVRAAEGEGGGTP